MYWGILKMAKQNGIGFLDSGLGGLTIAKKVVEELPNEKIIYFGDNLHIPYGDKPQSEVREYVLRIIDYLVLEQKVKYVVIACNTATVAALDIAVQRYQLPIIGPVDVGAKKAVNRSKSQKIGVLATAGTVKSNGYQEAIKSYNPQAEVIAVPCPKLTPLVERGELAGAEVEAAVRECLAPILSAGCDVVVLGCTHYPFLEEVIAKLSGGQLEIIFPGKEIAEKIRKYLTVHQLLNLENGGEEVCLTSKLANISQEFLPVLREKLQMELDFSELDLF